MGLRRLLEACQVLENLALKPSSRALTTLLFIHLHPSSIFIHHHSSSCIIIHHHPPSIIHHPSFSLCRTPSVYTQRSALLDSFRVCWIAILLPHYFAAPLLSSDPPNLLFQMAIFIFAYLLQNKRKNYCNILYQIVIELKT